MPIPFPNQLRYYPFSAQLRSLFGERVHRIPVDAGFHCPHRDRARTEPGCLYCDDHGSGAPFLNPALSVQEQIQAGIAGARQRYQVDKFLIYFQAYTNTLASTERLRALYEEALAVPGVVGLAVGTRPDALSMATLELLEELAGRTHFWLELGMESAHNDTLQRMNRQHTMEDLEQAVRQLQHLKLHLVLHIILGLPGESREEMLQTADTVARLGVEGVKIHSLYIDSTMPLAADFCAGAITLMQREEYVELAVDVLERLPEELVIHRLIGEGDPRTLLGPDWSLDKAGVLADIQRRLVERETRQGAKCIRELGSLVL